MENKPREEPGMLFPDDSKLYVVPLDDTAQGAETGNGTSTSTMPSKYDGAPMSQQVIHTPRRTHDRTVSPHKPGRACTGDRLLFVMTVVAVIVAFIALLIGGLGLSRRGDIYVNVASGTTSNSDTTTGNEETNSPTSEEEKVWLFAIGDYDVNLEYLDETSGEVRGYNVDIIKAVCRIAGKECSLVWDIYRHCWENVVAWSITYPRVRTFKFSDSISKQHLSVFMIAMGADPDSFNWRDLTGKTIGFLQSYADDDTCLRRIPEITGNNLGRDQVRYYITQQDLLTAVNTREVDAVFINEYLEVIDHLQLASDKLNRCTIGGQAMMVKKDSALPDWWDPAFQSLLDSPEYLHICEGIEDDNVHGSIPGPRLSEHCIGF